MQFAAEQIEANCCDDELTAYVWLAALGDGPPRYVTAARSLVPGADDRVYVEVDDQVRCGHDVVSRCLLRRDELRFEVTGEGARALGLGDDRIIVVALAAGPIESLWELRRALAVISLGTHLYREDLQRE